MNKKRFLKAIAVFSMIGVLAIGMVPMIGCPTTDTDDPNNDPLITTVYKIGISQYVTHPALDAVREGIIEGLAEKGYTVGDNIEIDYQNSELDGTLFASIAQKFVADQVDLIAAIATPNAQAAISAAEGTGIPVVFSAITDPVGSDMVTSWDSHPNENVTGVSDMIVVADDVNLILEILPGTATIGTIYNAGEDNSVFLVQKLNEACDALGIVVVERTVATSTDILAAAQSLIGQVDAIWIGTDNTVVTGLEALIGVCEDNDIPLFPADDPSIERGGIGCYGFDYKDIGIQTGWMIAGILDGDGTANNVPVEKGQIINLSLNLTAAEAMGVTVPQAVIDRAVTTY
ncbi:MAG: ABC transporter substrate-binding protein [Dehalococcoidales bacterium]|nr:ABC transporter substrate-binding protein [Dehalococcoidales bacterium]